MSARANRIQIIRNLGSLQTWRRSHEFVVSPGTPVVDALSRRMGRGPSRSAGAEGPVDLVSKGRPGQERGGGSLLLSQDVSSELAGRRGDAGHHGRQPVHRVAEWYRDRQG